MVPSWLKFPSRMEAAMRKLEFFFDCSSPWTYLAFESVQPLCERPDLMLEWRPFLVGGAFVAIEQDCLVPYARAAFRRYWAMLRSNTDGLIDRGGFGSPTFFLDDVDMYFGNDRLPLIERRLT